LSPYQDVVFWLDVKESTNTPTITFQTAPSKDEVFFVAIVPGTPMTVPVTGVTAIVPAFMMACLAWTKTSKPDGEATDPMAFLRSRGFHATAPRVHAEYTPSTKTLACV
jgi:hypothetical protein